MLGDIRPIVRDAKLNAGEFEIEFDEPVCGQRLFLSLKVWMPESSGKAISFFLSLFQEKK